MSKKSKSKSKNGSSKKNKPGKGFASFNFRDLTAERQFTNQFNKALKLMGESQYDESIAILETLEEKHPDRPQVFELLGMLYLTTGDAPGAREALSHALELVPPERRSALGPGNGTLLQFQLASAYFMSGYPLLSYEITHQIDCATLEQATQGAIDAEECRTFKQTNEEAVAVLMEAEQIPREEFLTYGLLIERGNLAVERYQPEAGIELLVQARDLQPRAVEPYRGLSAAYAIGGSIEKAVEQLEFVLNELEPGDLTTLNSLIRLLMSHGKTEQAQPFVRQLAELPLPEEVEDKVRMAATWAYLEDDQRIFDLLEPVLNSSELRDELAELEENEEMLTQALLLGTVAAAHLGQSELALRWLEEENEGGGLAEDGPSYPLLARTWQALEDYEVGPRKEERFFYHNPQTLLMTVILGQKNVVTAFEESLHSQESKQAPDNEFERLLKDHGDSFVETMLYSAWLIEDPANLPTTMNLIASYGAPDEEGEEAALAATDTPGLEIIRRLAFTRAGSSFLHLAAIIVLMGRGIVQKEEPVTIWLGREQHTGTFKELADITIKRSQEQKEIHSQSSE